MNRIFDRLRDMFAERQIYIRKNGSVTYVALSTRSLAFLTAIFIVISAWVGFASVQVIFSSGLGAQRERDVQEMQLAYENELNRLRLAYDDLNAELVLTRDWFSETTDNLEQRHNDLTLVFEQHAAISDELRNMQVAFARVAKRNKRDKSTTELVARSGDGDAGPIESRTIISQSGEKKITLTDNKAVTDTALSETIAMPHLSGRIFDRVASLDLRQQELLDALEESIDERIGEYENVIEGTVVLEPESFMASVLPEEQRAVGGPYIPLESSKPGINSQLHQQLYRISSNLERLQNLSASVAQIPLALPIHDYRVTSRFGPRLDPFKKRAAFHAGVDFGTATGTPVYSTLPGTVTRASYKGPYGLVVEIDHGNGFRTRYGHLARTRVRRGQRVEFQQHIADAGNSGRSTGPHLHYEVWYEGKVRDPLAFLDSGKQIFNIAETLSRPQNDK
ncbi:MAG: M23 family metallopeptidase [Parvibaculales bacterium]